jgi:glucose/arabinose dehydrogenase
MGMLQAPPEVSVPMRLIDRKRCFVAGVLFAAASCSNDDGGPAPNPDPTMGTNNGGSQSAATNGGSGAGLATGSGGGGAGEPNTNLPIAGSGGQSSSSGNGGNASTGTGGSANQPEPPALNPGALNCTAPAGNIPNLALTPFVTGLQQPLFVTPVPGDDTRLFVLQKGGAVRVIRDGQLVAQAFLDLTGRVDAQGERGLLGLAFHPNYQQNGLLYIHYSSVARDGLSGGTAVIAEFSTGGNADQADINTERRLIAQADGESNHNGGMLAFGPGGYLFASFGDGGGGGDQHGNIGNGQNLNTIFGKILRIDVNARDAGEYGIPAGNMAGQNVRPEIWSYGWRNPWRFSFDNCTGDMYFGEVGQNRLEEVDFEPYNTPGRNYGWRVMEAEECFNPQTNCNRQGLVDPVASYVRTFDVGGTSITGGYVYRGAAIPGLRGTYLYADYNSGNFWSLRMGENGAVANEATLITNDINPGNAPGNNVQNPRISGFSSFGQDNAGELYVTALNNGTVYRITAE